MGVRRSGWAMQSMGNSSPGLGASFMRFGQKATPRAFLKPNACTPPALQQITRGEKSFRRSSTWPGGTSNSPGYPTPGHEGGGRAKFAAETTGQSQY
jgi:hypothetical protein